MLCCTIAFLSPLFPGFARFPILFRLHSFRAYLTRMVDVILNSRSRHFFDNGNKNGNMSILVTGVNPAKFLWHLKSS